MIGRDNESPEAEKDGKVNGDRAGEDEGGTTQEGNDEGVRDDQKPVTYPRQDLPQLCGGKLSVALTLAAAAPASRARPLQDI